MRFVFPYLAVVGFCLSFGILPISLRCQQKSSTPNTTVSSSPAQSSPSASTIRSINKYGGLQSQFDGAGPKAVKSIPAEPDVREDETWENIWSNMKTSFEFPFEDFLKNNHVDGLSGGITATYPLSDAASQPENGSNSQGVALSSAVLGLSLSYKPISYWFVSVSVMRYFFPSQKQSWNPDFTYSFGYNDWHPYTFSFVYSNHQGNRLFPSIASGEVVTRFWEGNFSLGWKFPSAKLIEHLCVVHPSGGIGHSLHLNIHPQYRIQGAKHDELGYWKTALSFSTKYTIYEQIYANFTVFWYPIHGQQQPWDPDFTYGIGFFDWHPYTLSVQYNNHVGGRFPWNPSNAKLKGLLDGTLSLSWSFVF
ncbi:MAG: hypothetical protein EAZ92_10385 [Candidatus Kapaibacterium sp.]|nr:MAG: hypothetical protein EAZ92_10385 [Candidatus Kapabacteria bacterium]